MILITVQVFDDEGVLMSTYTKADTSEYYSETEETFNAVRDKIVSQVYPNKYGDEYRYG